MWGYGDGVEGRELLLDMPRWELASCRLRLERAAALAEVTAAIEAILEDNMDAAAIARVL